MSGKTKKKDTGSVYKPTDSPVPPFEGSAIRKKKVILAPAKGYEPHKTQEDFVKKVWTDENVSYPLNPLAGTLWQTPEDKGVAWDTYTDQRRTMSELLPYVDDYKVLVSDMQALYEKYDAYPLVGPKRRAAEPFDPYKVENRQRIAETCPKCLHPEMTYIARQLRSADEPLTIFWECPKCKHKEIRCD